MFEIYKAVLQQETSCTNNGNQRTYKNPKFVVSSKAIGLAPEDITMLTNGLPGDDESKSPFKNLLY